MKKINVIVLLCATNNAFENVVCLSRLLHVNAYVTYLQTAWTHIRLSIHTDSVASYQTEQSDLDPPTLFASDTFQMDFHLGGNKMLQYPL